MKKDQHPAEHVSVRDVSLAQESKGAHTGPYHACIADISRELKSVAYAQQESFENVQVGRKSMAEIVQTKVDGLAAFCRIMDDVVQLQGHVV